MFGVFDVNNDGVFDATSMMLCLPLTMPMYVSTSMMLSLRILSDAMQQSVAGKHRCQPAAVLSLSDRQ